MYTTTRLPSEQIAENGFYLTHVELPSAIRESVLNRDWEKLNAEIFRQTAKGGVIFDELLHYAKFSDIEFIISIRSSNVEPDEDGIWHDDGSRVLAFSLSLTLRPDAIEGGRLEIRKRSTEPQSSKEIPTPTFGTLIVFATGWQGFEHKINRVVQGERIVIAGWCT